MAYTSFLAKYNATKRGFRPEEDEIDPRQRDWRDEGFKWMRPETPAGRLFDILSRPNYAMANMALEGGRTIRDEKDDSVLGGLGRILAAGGRGLAGRDKVFFEDSLNEAEATKDWNPWVKTGVGTLADIFLDPTTYLSGGMTKLGKAGAVASTVDDMAKIGRNLDDASKAGRLLGWGMEKTGSSADELARIFRGGLASQAEGGMRGLVNFMGQPIIKGEAVYRGMERFPTWLAGTMDVGQKSKWMRSLDENVPGLRRGLDAAKRAFTPGNSNDPVLRAANLGAMRHGNVELARLAEGVQGMAPDVVKAARDSGNFEGYMRSLWELVEMPEGQRTAQLTHRLSQVDDQIAALKGHRHGVPIGNRVAGEADDLAGYMTEAMGGGRQARMLDVEAGLPGTRMPELAALEGERGDLVRRLNAVGQIAAESATDGDMPRYAKAIREFFDEAENVERGIYEARGLTYKGLDMPGYEYISHIQTQDAIAEISNRPELAGILADKTFNDPAQQQRMLRMGVTEINDAARRDLGILFGEDYRGLKLSTNLLEENPLVAVSIRGNRLKKVLSADDWVRRLVGDGIVQKVDNAIPVGMRTPELKASAWGEGVSLLDGYVAPHGMASEIERVFNLSHNVGAQGELLKAYDKVLNTWRGWALLSPSYHVRNVCSNVWQNFVAGVTDPRVYDSAADFQVAMKRFPKDGGAALDAFKLATPFGEFSGRELRELMFNEDLMGGFMSEWAREIDIMHAGLTPHNLAYRGNNALMKGNMAVGTMLENNARFALFFDTMQKGGSPVDAANMVRKFLFDYTDIGLSRFENDVVRRLTGFYRWTKNNMLLSTEQLFAQPGKYAGIPKIKHAIEQSTADIAPPEDYLPEWLAEGYAVRTPIKTLWPDKDTPSYFSLQNWLPAMQVAELFEDVDEHGVPGLSWSLGMLAPTLSLPLEQAMNKSMFYERPVEEFEGQRTRFLGQNMNPRAVHMLRSLRPLSEIDKFFYQEKPFSQAVQNWASGRTYPYDRQKQMKYARYERREQRSRLKSAWKKALRRGDQGEADRLLRELLSAPR